MDAQDILHLSATSTLEIEVVVDLEDEVVISEEEEEAEAKHETTRTRIAFHFVVTIASGSVISHTSAMSLGSLSINKAGIHWIPSWLQELQSGRETDAPRASTVV